MLNFLWKQCILKEDNACNRQKLTRHPGMSTADAGEYLPLSLAHQTFLKKRKVWLGRLSLWDWRKKRPGCLYFFQPITIVLGGATATVRLQKYCRGETGFGVTRPQKYHLQDANHGRKMATSPQDQTPQKLVKDVLKTATQPEVVGQDFSGWLVPPNERLIYAANFRPLRLHPGYLARHM